jgi:protein-S-isoprenylcysteine O-methyltransferase Ste14
MLRVVQTAGWVACVIYATIPLFWLMVHPQADHWRRRKASPYSILLPLWMGMWIAMGLLTGPWRGHSLYASAWSWIPAAMLFATGIWIYRQSGANFSWAQLGGLPELISGHREQGLVTTGIRARVRHPVYLGHLCEMVAWSIGTGLVVCWVLTGFAIVTGAVMIRMEDSELEKRFGEVFSAYHARVPAVWPRLYG